MHISKKNYILLQLFIKAESCLPWQKVVYPGRKVLINERTLILFLITFNQTFKLCNCGVTHLDPSVVTSCTGSGVSVVLPKYSTPESGSTVPLKDAVTKKYHFSSFIFVILNQKGES